MRKEIIKLQEKYLSKSEGNEQKRIADLRSLVSSTLERSNSSESPHGIFQQLNFLPNLDTSHQKEAFSEESAWRSHSRRVLFRLLPVLAIEYLSSLHGTPTIVDGKIAGIS